MSFYTYRLSLSFCTPVHILFLIRVKINKYIYFYFNLFTSSLFFIVYFEASFHIQPLIEYQIEDCTNQLKYSNPE